MSEVHKGSGVKLHVEMHLHSRTVMIQTNVHMKHSHTIVLV